MTGNILSSDLVHLPFTANLRLSTTIVPALQMGETEAQKVPNCFPKVIERVMEALMYKTWQCSFQVHGLIYYPKLPLTGVNTY